MIKFFRTIRKDQVNNNRAVKYLTYAIGEIILVVIGILIALQINNWNNQKQERQFETKVLREILVETEEDLNETRDAMDGIKNSQHSSEIILNSLSSNDNYSDTLNTHFSGALRFWSLSPNSTAFEAAKSEGLYIIKNDSIRKLVAKVNGYHLNYIRVLESRWQDYNNSIVIPKITASFDYYNLKSIEPNDFQSLKKDVIYKGMLQTLKHDRTRYIDMLKIRNALLEKLKSLLERELR